MDTDNICSQLYEIWEDVSKNWSADAKTKYHNLIFNELLRNSQSVYSNNRKLQSEAQACLSICGVMEDY